MRRCEKCNVDVRGGLTKCPLCQNVLTGEREPSFYPEIKTVYKQFERLFRIIILCMVIVATISIALNVTLPHTMHWCIYVLLGLVCFWLCLYTGIKKKHNIPQNITNQTLFVTVLSIVWDWSVGWHGWSFDFVIPITCVVAMVTMAIAAQILHMPTSDYVFWLAINILFGIAPLVFYVMGLLDYSLPSIICISASIISLAAVILFQGGAIRQEIIKRFHI